jgi:hypothetical protein
MKTTFRDVLIFIICLLIIGVVVDFINYKTILNTIKKELPTEYQAVPYTFIRGYGYVPLLWRGNFSRISFTDYKNPRPDLHDYLIVEFSGHNHLWIDVDSLGDNLYLGEWTQTQKATEYIEDKREGWEKIQQPFGTYCEVYLKIEKDKALVVLFGEDRVFIREFKCRIGTGVCGGGYTSFYWP